MTAHTHIAGDDGRKGGGSNAHDGGKQGTPNPHAISSGQNKCSRKRVFPTLEEKNTERKSEMSPTKATDAEPPLPPIQHCRRHCLFRWLTELLLLRTQLRRVILILDSPKTTEELREKEGMTIDHREL